MVELLTVQEVAAWVLPDELEIGPFQAAPPPLQRGSVWKPHQIEHIWDSITREFPIGSLLLTPYQENLRQQKFAFGQRQQEKHEHEYQYDLLDGQQRCTAIAVGFLNAWNADRRRLSPKDALSDAPFALWIDLAAEALKEFPTDNRKFLFRVTSRSHPWGYRRGDPSKPLTASQCRDARDAYKAACSDTAVTFRAGKMPLYHTWPWDSFAPVPLPLLIEASRTDSPRASLLRALQSSLPFWNSARVLPSMHGDWKQKVYEYLDEPKHAQEIDSIISALRNMLGKNGQRPSYLIPAIVFQVSRPEPDRRTERPDPLITLFDRVNRGGTRLDDEELQYSLLKSAWPGCVDLVEKLSTHLMPPARLVLIVSRLILARMTPGDKQNKPPDFPSLEKFRRLIRREDDEHYRDFMTELQDYIQNGRAQKLFAQARKLLVLDNHEPPRFRLPPVLAADLAGSKSQSHAFFLFLAWLDGRAHSGDLEEGAHRRLLGALTILNWFADRPGDCVSTLWPQRTEFFDQGSLYCCLKLTPENRFQLIPLPPPGILRNGIVSAVTKSDGFEHYGGQLWKNTNWYDGFASNFANSKEVNSWYQNGVNALLQERTRDAWRRFCDIVPWKRELLLYAQRDWLLRWFEDFDPASPARLEDTHRPFDYDHIHPQSYLANNTPSVIRDWHRSIGNLRAWPLGANRAAGDGAPTSKLSNPSTVEYEYGLQDRDDLMRASIVDAGNDFPDWQKAVPNDAPRRYLAQEPQFMNFHHGRKALLKAITERLVALYREWYDTLHVAELLSSGHERM